MPYKQINNRKELKEQRRTLRSRLTPAEATLWTLLQGKQLDGRKFRRQHSVGNYILDFYCPKEKLAIELDGEPHFVEAQIKRDEIRTKYLNELGIRVIRFENEEIFQSPMDVLNEIKKSFNHPSSAEGRMSPP